MGMASKADRVSGIGGLGTNAPTSNMLTASAMSTMGETAASAQIGDLFQYSIRQKITVLQNQSALVPIVQSRVEAEKITLWNERETVPLRALWLKNTSGLTLDGGTFNILEGDSFAGEGLFQEMKPDEKRLLSFAADTAVRIRPEIESTSHPYTRIAINKGTMKLIREQREKRTYTVHNSDTNERQVIIEHPVRTGWKFVGDVKPEESSVNFHRFRVKVDGGKTEKLSFEESYPQETFYSISSINDEFIRLTFVDQKPKPEIEAAFKRVIDKKGEISDVDRQIAQANQEVERINREQTRLRENMKALKGSPEEKALLQRYVGQLNTQEDRLAGLNQEIGKLNEQHNKLYGELNQIIAQISIDEEM
jgi:hypothetical protein